MDDSRNYETFQDVEPLDAGLPDDNILRFVTKDGKDTLLEVLSKMFGVDIVRADYQTTQLKGGTVGDVRLVTGIAETGGGGKMPYRLVLKIQKQWERYGDPGSWRREYDLYVSGLGAEFSSGLRWPNCYLAEMNDGETRLWMEYIDGVSGLDLTGDMYEQAAYELGRFQGRLFAEKPSVLDKLSNLGKPDAMKNYYLHYRSWKVVYDYIRSKDCEIPGHLCKMLIDIDENAEEVLARIEKLPQVLCHRDYWVTNIFYKDGGIILIDWDTAGWGRMGEDLSSLIADEADVENKVKHYHTCVPAYYKGFSEYADISHITDDCVWELILLMFGYRLVEGFVYAGTPEDKALQVATLQKIYEMSEGTSARLVSP